MSAKLKLFFDACCSKLLPSELVQFYLKDYPHLVADSLIQRFRASRADPRWIQRLADEGDWIIFSFDKGRNNKKAPLPLVCAEHNVHHVLFSPSIQRGGATAQKNAVVGIWLEIPNIYSHPPGTQFRLNQVQRPSGVPSHSLRVVEHANLIREIRKRRRQGQLIT